MPTMPTDFACHIAGTASSASTSIRCADRLGWPVIIFIREGRKRTMIVQIRHGWMMMDRIEAGR